MNSDITQSELDGASDRILEMLRIAIDRGVVSKDQVFKSMKVKGRSVPDLPKFTFKGSGITVGIRKLGPFTIDAIGRQMRTERKPPVVPKVMANYGSKEAPNMVLEENPADPEYQAELARYEREVEDAGGRRILDTIIKHAVVLDDIDYDAVAEMREFLSSVGITQEELDKTTDQEIYVKHICIKIPTDISDLQEFVIGESLPSEEAVQAHEDSFRGNVQGQADTKVSSDLVGDTLQG